MFFANQSIKDDQASQRVQNNTENDNGDDNQADEIFNFDEISSADEDTQKEELESVQSVPRRQTKGSTGIVKLNVEEQSHMTVDNQFLKNDFDGGVYEPGLHSEKETSKLPQLQKLNNTIKYQQELDNTITIPQYHQQQNTKHNVVIMKKQIKEYEDDRIDIQQFDQSSRSEQSRRLEPQLELVCEQSDEDAKNLKKQKKEDSKDDDQIQFDEEEDLDQVIDLNKVTQQYKEKKDEQEQNIDLQQQQNQVQNKGSPFPPKFNLELFPSTKQMLKNFLTAPLPYGQLLQCTIKRSKGGFRLYPVYHLLTSDGNNYMLSAKKVVMNSTSNYIVCMDQDKLSTKNEGYLGKVKSNFMGTEFMLYDNGINPKKTRNSMLIRSQLGVVFYESNILQNRGPRKMKVIIPKVHPETNIPKQYMPLNSKSGIQQDFKYEKTEYIDYFVNKTPRWNEQMQAYVLNFYGRVDKPSVKNFQLIHPEENEKVQFQFGRVDDYTFNLDFTWPFSPLQAMQICVSSFDFKFACE